MNQTWLGSGCSLSSWYVYTFFLENPTILWRRLDAEGRDALRRLRLAGRAISICVTELASWDATEDCVGAWNVGGFFCARKYVGGRRVICRVDLKGRDSNVVQLPSKLALRAPFL